MSGSISGLASGLDTENIINGLMSIKRQRVDNLTTQKEDEYAKQSAWSSISSKMLSLQLASYSLSKTSTFDMKTARVSDADVLSVTATSTATAGSYSFYVDQLATTHQISSNGFMDYDTTPVGAGTIELELGNGDVERKTELNILNGGEGITRGYIKITDRDNNSATIDLTDAMYVDDVINAINNTSTISVTASINSNGDGIDLAYSGAGVNNFKVEEVSGGTTATDLGILDDVAGATISGDNIFYLNGYSNVNLVNDGLGVRKESFLINDGVEYTIDISGANTIQDVLDEINNTAGLTVTASLSSDGKGITLTAAGAFTVSENGYSTAEDLGILNLIATGDGDRIYASMDSVLLKNLSGTNETGINGTSFLIGATTIDISTAESLSDVIELIDAQSGVTNVKARYNSAKNGLELYSTNSTNFTVSEDGSTTADDLGILGASSNYILKGQDVDIKYLSHNTLLSTLNQGDGVRHGKISITDTDNNSFEVDLSSSSTLTTLGDIIDAINTDAAFYNITASINATGDGLLLTDTNGGASNLAVAEVGTGHMAADLGILGTSTTGTLDGTFETSVTISATDTLSDVQEAINDLDLNIQASIINDGSSSPYRLVFTSKISGTEGRIIMNTDIDSFSFDTAVDAKDAILVMGEPTSESAVFTANSSNKITDFIAGITIDLKAADTNPITVTLENDLDSVVEYTSDFVDKLNTSISAITAQLKYAGGEDVEPEPLFGDATLMLLQSSLYQTVTQEVSGLSGSITSLSQVGISMGFDGSISLNEAELREALSTEHSDVKEFFTATFNNATGATITSSGVDAPWSDAGGTDGNTNMADYATGATGWQSDNGASYEMDFGENIELTSLNVYGVDTNIATDLIDSFTIQYWDSSAGAWTDYRDVTGYGSTDFDIYFPYGLNTSKIRLNNIQGVDTKAKILDVQAKSTVGIAGALELAMSKVTDANTGTIDAALDGVDDRIEVLNEQIATQESRMNAEEDRLRKQFVQLEKMMSELNNVSTWMGQQVSALNSGWNYKK